MVQPKIILISPLPITQCERHLREVTDPPWKIFGSGKVIGSVNDRQFRWRKRSIYASSFQSRLRGTFSDVDGQTQFVCYFGQNRLIAAFWTVWFWGTLLLGSGILAKIAHTTLYYHRDATTDIVGLLTSSLIGIALMLSAGLRAQARSDLRFLTDFLQGTVRGRPVAQEDGSH